MFLIARETARMPLASCKRCCESPSTWRDFRSIFCKMPTAFEQFPEQSRTSLTTVQIHGCEHFAAHWTRTGRRWCVTGRQQMLRGSRDMRFYENHKLDGGQEEEYCSMILEWKEAHH